MGAHYIKVGGIPASNLAKHGPLTYETLADGGCGEGRFSFSLPPKARPSAVRPGKILEAFCSLVPIYAGVIVDYDHRSGDVVARGISAAANDYLALDAGGNATRDVATATLQAAVAGWPVRHYGDATGSANGDTSGGPQSLQGLIDEVAEDLGSRWGVDARRRLYVREDPAGPPKWLIRPGAAAFDTTSEGVVSHYAVRYYNGTTYATVIVPHPQAVNLSTKYETLDLTERGTLGVMQATAIAGGLHQLHNLRYQWVNGVTVVRDQITTIGGTPATLERVRGGDLVRVLGTPAAGLTGSLWQDVVIGKTLHTAGEDDIYLEPVNTAPRTHAAVIAAL